MSIASFGAAGEGGAGGGGSGFVNPSATNVINAVGVRTGNGLVIVSYPLTPTSKDQCKHGGWRNLTDDHGQPFKNQGDCLRWVITHRTRCRKYSTVPGSPRRLPCSGMDAIR